MSKPAIFINESNRVAMTNGSGQDLYFSYKTLVALRDSDGKSYRTDKFWSRTTSKHLGQFGMGGAEKVDQKVLEGMVK
jgi:hypothetical protein